MNIVYGEIYGFNGPRLLETKEAFIEKLKEEQDLRNLEIPFTGEKIEENDQLEVSGMIRSDLYD